MVPFPAGVVRRGAPGRGFHFRVCSRRRAFPSNGRRPGPGNARGSPQRFFPIGGIEIPRARPRRGGFLFGRPGRAGRRTPGGPWGFPCWRWRRLRTARRTSWTVQAPATAIAGAETPVTVRWRKSTGPPGPPPVDVVEWGAAAGRTLGDGVDGNRGRERPFLPPVGRGRDAFPGGSRRGVRRKIFRQQRADLLHGNSASSACACCIVRPPRPPLRVLLRAQLKTDPAVDLVPPS